MTLINSIVQHNAKQVSLVRLGDVNKIPNARVKILQRKEEKDCEYTYKSQNDNLHIHTVIKDEGDRVVGINKSVWFDSKLKKIRKRISQTVYDV